jgi:hypothetical protein
MDGVLFGSSVFAMLLSCVLKFFVAVPAMPVHAGSIPDQLPQKDKQDAATIFRAMTMAQMPFAIARPEQKNACRSACWTGVGAALQMCA